MGIFFQAVIEGDVTITGATAHPDASGETFGGSANAICTTEIRGDVTISGSGPNAPWNLGSTNYPPYANFSNCVFPNTIRGTVRFTDNASTVNAIGGNDIAGDLVCTGNAGFAPGFVAPGRAEQGPRYEPRSVREARHEPRTGCAPGCSAGFAQADVP